MVKNIPTIERSTKIRFGKHATDDQAENTIVFNASNVAIDASTAGGVYVTPMRTVDPSTPEITVLSYNTITKEIVNSDTASADLFNSNLHFVSQRGNVTSNTLQFTNPTTAFITTGGVGIGSSVLIDSSATNQVQVSGTIKTGELHADNIGISNTSPKHALSLGNEGQLRLNVPTGSIYALETVGNVSAQNYIGDGGLLSNVTLQTVTDKSNITSNTLQLTNPTTSLKAYSNIIVDGKITVGTPIETTSGGTGHDTYIPGTILYGTDTGTSLGQLVPAGSNQDAGKFLRLDASDIPEWAEVPLTLDAVLGDTTAISDGSMDLTGTGTTITTAGKIKAASFEGLGSELDGINAANVAPLTGTFTTSVLPIVPVTKGGTGLTSVAQNELLLGTSSGDALAKLSAYTGPTSITAPPSGMSSTTQTIGGIQYTSSASTTRSGTATNNAFDHDNTTIWRSADEPGESYASMDGYYGGSNTTGSYSGAWIQLYRATAIAPTSIQIIASQTTSIPAPNGWKVFGSTNGSSWTEIHSSSTPVTWNSGNGHTATISGSAAYNYLRLAVQYSTMASSMGTIAVSEVRFSAQGTGPTEKFLRSSAAGVSWDEVSSTLQTITDGGASTTNEISFTNGVTSLTASGNVVATGNVTASTFKSTTLTSGKIPYVNNDNELIDGPIGHDSTTNNTFVSSNLYVTGNLTVQGTTTFQDSNIHTVSDPIIEIGNANAIDTIDMGVIMTRPTANVVSGYMGDEKKYVIAYTLSDPDGAHIVPTNATSDQFMTLSVEGGNVLAGNVTTTGKMTADSFHGNSINVVSVDSGTFSGDGTAITNLDLGHASHTGQVLLAKGGTGLTSVAQNELLLGPASGDALAKLSAYTGPTSITAPVAMTTNSSGGNTASSTVPFSVDAYKAFDGSDSTNYISPSAYSSSSPYGYTGSNSLGGVNGEWVKIQLASAITPTSVFVKARPFGTDFAVPPNSWRIMGSTDGTNWTQLHASTTLVDSSSGTTESFINTTSYTYLGFVVTNISFVGPNDPRWTLSRLLFSGPGSGPSEKFLKSSAAGVSWDEVSSTLQAITDGGVTTTHTIAFNNATTGLTSAGDIDIAATKQIDYAGDVLLKSSAGAVASLKVTNAIKLDPVPFAPATVPVAMTANSSGGNTASAGYGSTNAWKAFDGSDSTTYTSEDWAYNPSTDSYTSSQSLGGISGDWLKIQPASAIIPISVFLKSVSNPNSDASGVPDEWRILGSNDDTNWTQLHSSTTAVDQSSGTTESFINTTAYSYIAIVVTSLTQPGMGGYHWALSRLSFTASPPPSNNVLSINTTTGEIYDSGGQGGSTLDNIHEEGSNVAIGPSAASANLTVNTYGSNVLTVSGNVSADNITIGALNVAASPFALDDVVSINAGANVTANVLTLGGLVTSGNVDASNIIVSGNTTSQNIKLTNTDISATISSGTITIDAREKSYGTAPLVVSTTDVSNLVFSNLITGAQIVVPILASGGDIKISKELTNVNFYAMTTDVSVTQDKHALMTLSNLYGNIYMNAIGFA